MEGTETLLHERVLKLIGEDFTYEVQCHAFKALKLQEGSED
jgi:hypothetical protein